VKNAIRLLITTLGLAGASFAGVTVSSPAPGSTAGSPVHFVASASSTLPITAMRIYVDNVSVYLVSASKLDTSLAMSSGSHFVVVQAWDSSGAVFKTPLNLSVSGTTPTPTPTPTPPSTLPTPPANAITKSNIDQMTGWELHRLRRRRRQRSGSCLFDGPEPGLALARWQIDQVQHQRHQALL